MIQPYDYPHTVQPEEIDVLGHANNVVYVDWMQSAAVAHSAVLGWTTERYQAMGRGWVVRSHMIKYHQPARAAEAIVVRTWVATMNKATSTRRYQVLRQADGALLAEAETLWAFIDYASGRPARIPVEITAAFPTAKQESEVSGLKAKT
jgi:acyl-CoA thioester hydrolase